MVVQCVISLGLSDIVALISFSSSDESLTSCAEFVIQKLSSRSADPIRRTLCLTETCLVERDPATYSVVTCKPLCDVRIILSPQTRIRKKITVFAAILCYLLVSHIKEDKFRP